MRRLILVMAATLVAAFTSFAQTGHDARAVVRDVNEAMVSGNPDVFSRISAEQIELTVDGQTSVYTKAQARYVASAFLDKHPLIEARVREVNVVGRQCTARSRLIGSDRAEAWELYLRMRRTPQGWEVKELRLTPASGSGSPG